MNKKIILILSIIAVLIIATYTIVKNINKNETSDSDSKSNLGTSTSSNSNSNSSVKDSKEVTSQDKSIFNAGFTKYEGQNIDAQNVKYLIASVNKSNEISNIGKVNLTLNGEACTDFNKVNTSKTYSVSFEYDDNGIINKAIVKQN